MDTAEGDLSERERRLGEVIFACLQALERGQAPDPRELMARHPEFAGELAEFFDDRAHIQRVAASLREAAQAAPPEGPVDAGPPLNYGEPAGRPGASIDPGPTGGRDARDHPPLSPGAAVRYLGDYVLLRRL